MPANQSRETQRFFRVAEQRFEEAEYLFKGERYAAAIYLGGYSVECSLKAMIVSIVPKGQQFQVAAGFRGGGWHNFEKLRGNYMDRGGTSFPVTIAKPFSYVSRWTVEARYIPGERPSGEAKLFLDSTKMIVEWIQGRL